ncbi:unnamed protein product [Trifolium pratense]|uniref:Uncharacterized protein n=1 Tax=Trifolium pratense TaxID=57577 RepID=A0ACB0JF15_TRIPR|nr:unnamed protein product [Trifolium pratense]
MVYMEKRLVGSAFDEIADVVPGKERVRIKARVIRLWKVPAFLNPNESGSIELRWFLSKVLLTEINSRFFFLLGKRLFVVVKALLHYFSLPLSLLVFKVLRF